jgi:hypothetical protein
MASTSRPKRIYPGVRRGASLLLVTIAMAIGCRTGLPPESPARDATNPDAAIPAYEPAPNPLSTSAFAGQKLGKGGHMHHGHGMAGKEDMAKPTPKGTDDSPHSEHGTHTAEPAPSDTDDSKPEAQR